MKPVASIYHKFVHNIPEVDDMEDAVVYVSIQFATASHKCCCGCASEVITPLAPSQWKLTFDGESISLNPSIGNWNFECRSHYWIRRNRVIWIPEKAILPKESWTNALRQLVKRLRIR